MFKATEFENRSQRSGLTGADKAMRRIAVIMRLIIMSVMAGEASIESLLILLLKIVEERAEGPVAIHLKTMKSVKSRMFFDVTIFKNWNKQ